jgi:murein DD-endopeptidase MepM/ murein hydrolase activator NlpD
LQKNAIKSLFLALFYGRLIFAIVLLGVPSSANAGVFSFFSGILSAEVKPTQSIAPINSQNSQTIDLLEPTLNPDPNAGKGGGDITVVGGTALLPEVGPSGTLADIEEAHSTDHISIYIVHKGDSLSQIAKMFGVSVNTIVWANDLSNGTIREGQTLIILPVSGVRHIVKQGDSIKKIVDTYKADLTEVLQFNNLRSDSKLAVGDEIIIPDAELAVRDLNAPTRTSPLRGAGGPNYQGYYAKPLASYRKSQGLHGYNGVDLAAPEGTPVMAAASGEVIISKNYGWNGGYGNYIVIKHPNGTQTLYAHLTQNIAFQGYSVVQGQVIGYVGTTGKSTGAHLHFEVRGAKNPF